MREGTRVVVGIFTQDATGDVVGLLQEEQGSALFPGFGLI
jgi:hypothetical protein